MHTCLSKYIFSEMVSAKRSCAVSCMSEYDLQGSPAFTAAHTGHLHRFHRLPASVYVEGLSKYPCPTMLGVLLLPFEDQYHPKGGPSFR